jgi:hypothetical protein
MLGEPETLDATPRRKVRYPALPILDRALILGLAVTQFLVGHGRVWAKPFDWDRSIVWSYVTIAVLVPIALLIRRKFNPVSWLLHTVELIGIKFLLTASFLIAFLVTHPQATAPAKVPPKPAPSVDIRTEVKARPKPTILPEGSLGELDGRVIGVDGQAAQGALVFISEGLADLVFESSSQPVTLQNDGIRFSPSVAAIQTHQPLIVRSANHELHTLQMTKQDRSWVLNVPILASGEGRTLEFDEPKALVTVECKVHQAREGQAHLAILNHPFFAITDADGRFALKGVPGRALTLSAFDPIRGEGSASVRLGGGERFDVSLQLAPRSNDSRK